MTTEPEKNNKYAIILSKNKKIVQVRIFCNKKQEVVRHAKAFIKANNEWYDSVSVIKTIDHIIDLSKNKQK